MPRYKVLSPGFYDGRLYDPEGKRPVLYTDKPFTKANPMPSWLGNMPEESATAKKARIAAEKKQATADAKKTEQDEQDIKNHMTMGEGETSFMNKKSNVETL